MWGGVSQCSGRQTKERGKKSSVLVRFQMYNYALYRLHSNCFLYYLHTVCTVYHVQFAHHHSLAIVVGAMSRW